MTSGVDLTEPNNLGFASGSEQKRPSVQQSMAALETCSDNREKRSLSTVSPISTLPAELFREIILLSTRPDDQPRTISLSHISPVWRDICLSCKSLFSDADWDEWPIWLLAAWCERANGTPLNVKLGWKGMGRLSSALKAQTDGGEVIETLELLTLLSKTRSSWSTLSAQCSASSCTMTHHEHEQCGTFLLSDVPQLVALSYSACNWGDERSFAFSTQLPNLRELYACGVALAPLSTMSHLSIITLPLEEILTDGVRVSPWVEWLSELPPSSVLKELRIPEVYSEFFDEPVVTGILLPSIEVLEIQATDDVMAVAYLFQATHFPNLHSCTLSHTDETRDDWFEWANWLQAMVTIFLLHNPPNLSNLWRCLQTMGAPMLNSLSIRLSCDLNTSVQHTYELLHALNDKSRVPHLSSLDVADQDYMVKTEKNYEHLELMVGGISNAIERLSWTHQMRKLSLPGMSPLRIERILHPDPNARFIRCVSES